MGLRFERVKLNNLGILSHFPKLKLIFSRKRNQVVEKVTIRVSRAARLLGRTTLRTLQLLANFKIIPLGPMLHNLAVTNTEDMDELPLNGSSLGLDLSEQGQSRPVMRAPQSTADHDLVALGDHVVHRCHLIRKRVVDSM